MAEKPVSKLSTAEELVTDADTSTKALDLKHEFISSVKLVPSSSVSGYITKTLSHPTAGSSKESDDIKRKRQRIAELEKELKYSNLIKKRSNKEKIVNSPSENSSVTSAEVHTNDSSVRPKTKREFTNTPNVPSDISVDTRKLDQNSIIFITNPLHLESSLDRKTRTLVTKFFREMYPGGNGPGLDISEEYFSVESSPDNNSNEQVTLDQGHFNEIRTEEIFIAQNLEPKELSTNKLKLTTFLKEKPSNIVKSGKNNRITLDIEHLSVIKPWMKNDGSYKYGENICPDPLNQSDSKPTKENEENKHKLSKPARTRIGCSECVIC